MAPQQLTLYVDNKAALAIAQNGPNWRTRYFAVRGHRLQEEQEQGMLSLMHCPTAAMLADAMTKLATAPVLACLHKAVGGELPEIPAGNHLPISPQASGGYPSSSHPQGKSKERAAATSSAQETGVAGGTDALRWEEFHPAATTSSCIIEEI